MSKWMKRIAATGVVLICLGMLLTLGAAAAGGLSVVRKGAGHIIEHYIGTEDMERIGALLSAASRSGWDGITPYADGSMRISRDGMKLYERLEGAKNVAVSVERTAFRLESGTEPMDGPVLYVQQDPDMNVAITRETSDPTVRVKLSYSGGRRRGCGAAVLVVPEDWQFEEFSVDGMAGFMQLEDVQAGRISLSVKAGEIRAQTLRAKALTVDADAGEVSARAAGAEQVDASAKAGAVSLHISGAEDEFDVRIKNKAGNVRIGEMSYVGMNEDSQRRGAADRAERKEILVDCVAASVEIDFSEDFD
ncbi:MAG: DUF4097 domain-containing protein [Clostridium sp.]|nr:DUF4097 domain-containing protein [Clostridium sp.]